MADALVELAARLGASATLEDGTLVFRPASRDEAAMGVKAAHGLGIRFEREGRASLDLSRLTRILDVDAPSNLVHAEVGATLEDVERVIAPTGRALVTAAPKTLTLGEYLATGCAGAPSPDDDPVTQAVAGLEAVTPDGRRLDLRPAPRRAIGPDLIGGISKSGWSLAIPLSVHLTVRPKRVLHPVAHRFDRRTDAEGALAWMRGRGVRPVHTRLRQEGEGAVLSIWLEGGPLLSPMQRIVTEEAKKRGGQVVEPDAYEAEERALGASPTLDALADARFAR